MAFERKLQITQAENGFIVDEGFGDMPGGKLSVFADQDALASFVAEWASREPEKDEEPQDEKEPLHPSGDPLRQEEGEASPEYKFYTSFESLSKALTHEVETEAASETEDDQTPPASVLPQT